jgi:fatty-acyl-CoA synthase
VCAHEDYLEAVDGIRAQLPRVEHFVALEGSRAELARIRAAGRRRRRPRYKPVTITERDLLTINYTSGTTSRPKGVMITHRNAYMNVVGTLIHLPMTPRIGTCGRCRCSTPTAGRTSGLVTAVGAVHVCLRKSRSGPGVPLMAEESITSLCAAPPC